jgi:hypothetical protein
LKYCAILTLVLMRWFAQYQSKASQIINKIIAIVMIMVKTKSVFLYAF